MRKIKQVKRRDGARLLLNSHLCGWRDTDVTRERERAPNLDFHVKAGFWEDEFSKLKLEA